MVSTSEVIIYTLLSPIFLVIGCGYCPTSFPPVVPRSTEVAWNRVGIRREKRDIKFKARNAQVYESLALKPGPIRLLTPSSPQSSTLVYNLECVSRGSRQYQALSYVWGSPVLSHRIKVNGKDLMVTKNLYMALESLQLRPARALWIDAICINQQDTKERSEQVQHMRFIYRDAVDVIVCLGKAPSSFGRIKDLFQGPANGVFEDGRGPTGHIFLDLLQRPWWKRMWVIQELILAQRVIVQCGHHRFSWDSFAQLIELFWNDANRGADVLNARNMATTRSHWLSNRAYEHGLLSLAWQFRERAAGDARDKLYALLGLLQYNQHVVGSFEFAQPIFG